MDLSNNTILITGGSSGLGYQFASRLIDLGNTVIITGRDQRRLDEAKKQLPKVHTFKSDVSSAKAITELFESVVSQFPDLNILINNAGEMRIVNLQDSSNSLEDVTRELDINLLGPIRMVQQFLPHLLEKKAGAVVNVTSGLALIPFPVSPVYGASKSGLHSYTQSLRVQLKNTSVKVFELLAPASNTPLNDKFIHVDGYDQKLAVDPSAVIDAAIKGMKNDAFEIYPGSAKLLKLVSRVAPSFLLKQTSKVGSKQWLPLKPTK